MESYNRWREQIVGCPIHQGLVDLIIEDLCRQGYFKKSNVIEVMNLDAIEEGNGIHWRYLTLLVEDTLGLMPGHHLAPLTQVFFDSAHGSPGGRKIPAARCFALGHGKRCHGYATSVYQDFILEGQPAVGKLYVV